MTTRSTNPRRRPTKAEALWQALRECPPLSQKSLAKEHLWLVLEATACTKTNVDVVPFGSAAMVEVTRDYAHDELVAAMEWLHANEIRARQLTPDRLYAIVRSVATRGAHGSARAVQADQLHGMTNVPSGTPVLWFSLDEEGVAS
jgi:hypothetical protein